MIWNEADHPRDKAGKFTENGIDYSQILREHKVGFIRHNRIKVGYEGWEDPSKLSDELMDKYISNSSWLDKTKSKTPELNKISSETMNSLIDYTNGMYTHYCEYSQALIEKKEGEIDWKNKWAAGTDIQKDQEQTKEIMNHIKSSQVDYDLYRFELLGSYRDFSDFKVGDEISWGIRSVSQNSNWLDSVISGADEGIKLWDRREVVTYTIKGKKNALDISPISTYDQDEALVCGKYKIKEVNTVDYTKLAEKEQNCFEKHIETLAKKGYEDYISGNYEKSIKFGDTGMKFTPGLVRGCNPSEKVFKQLLRHWQDRDPFFNFKYGAIDTRLNIVLEQIYEE